MLTKSKRTRIHSKVDCTFCQSPVQTANIKRHEAACYMNPTNTKPCVVCAKPIKAYKTSTTCSYSCSNKHFRSGENNGNWKEEAYRTTCFLHHKKQCVVCSEQNIVEVHHLDENRENNKPENLIPLCPTHHQYWHSKFRHLIETTVRNYVDGLRLQPIRSDF